MLIDFNDIKEVTIPGMNNGTGTMTAKVFMDEHSKVISCSVHPGSSIGLHMHETGDDINYVISGTGKAICDGKEEILKKLDTEYEYFLFDNIDAHFSKKEIKNILLSKLMDILDNKDGFLTTNREIVKDCCETVVYIERKKDKSSYCSKVAICPHVQENDSNKDEEK